MPHLSLFTSHFSPPPAAWPYNPALALWLSVDPLSDKSPGVSPYVYCGNNPVRLVDPNGKKERPFDAKKDKPITSVSGTETPIFFSIHGRRHLNRNAYNCHSYAWHNSQGDPNPAPNDIPNGLSKWDNSPADDIIEQNAKQLGKDEANIVGDIVIYYTDSDGNGQYDNGEFISHSAVVSKVDEEGYTIEVTGKMGEGPISTNHPDAPNYYKTAQKDQYSPPEKQSRAYFRLPKSTEE